MYPAPVNLKNTKESSKIIRKSVLLLQKNEALRTVPAK